MPDTDAPTQGRASAARAPTATIRAPEAARRLPRALKRHLVKIGKWGPAALASDAAAEHIRAATKELLTLETRGILPAPDRLPDTVMQTYHIPIYPDGADSRTAQPIGWRTTSRLSTLPDNPERRYQVDADRPAPVDGLGPRGTVDPQEIAVRMADGCDKTITTGTWPQMADHLGLDGADARIKRRVVDACWWRPRIRRQIVSAIEAAHRIIDPAGLNYASDLALRSSEQMDAAAARVAEETMLVNDDGEILPGGIPDPLRRDKRHLGELTARSAGITKLAMADGYKEAAIITITCPGHMHPTTTAGGGERRANPKWDGTTPGQANEWLQGKWKLLRPRLGRLPVPPIKFWTCSVQPHKDGTPHWHLIACLPDHAAAEELRDAMIATYGTESVHIVGPGRPSAPYPRQIEIKLIEGGAESALWYILRALKYIYRGLDTCEDEDEAKSPEIEEARRITAWARTHGIRRFRTSHSKATVWRLLRRPDVDVKASGADAAAAQEAARAGDFAGFFGAVQRAGMRPALAMATNRYGEPVRRVIGLQVGATVHVPAQRWKLSPAGHLTSERAPAGGPLRTLRRNNQGKDHATLNPIGLLAGAPLRGPPGTPKAVPGGGDVPESMVAMRRLEGVAG